MPNAALTPGAVLTTDATIVCKSGYASSVRDVPTSERRSVFVAYGLAYPPPSGAYEVDHLISLELGGSNTIENLWPEPYKDPNGAHLKDRLENYLHEQVCTGKLDLLKAQHQIATNWYQAWVDAGRP